MLARKDEVVKGLTDGVRFLFKKNKIEPSSAPARLASPTSGRRPRNDGGSETTLEAGHILLATGSEPIALPFLPFDGKTIVSSTEALAFDRVPEHLIVVGGGYIGLELGSVWKRLGSKVTVLEFLPRIVPMADVEIGGAAAQEPGQAGAGVPPRDQGHRREGRGRRGDRRRPRRRTARRSTFEGDKVLVAVGRRPYTEGLGLEEAGVKFDEKTGQGRRSTTTSGPTSRPSPPSAT